MRVITLCQEGSLAARNGSKVIRETNGTEAQVSSDYLSTSMSPGLAVLSEAVPLSVEAELREDVAPSVEPFQSDSVSISGNGLENLEEKTLSLTYLHSISSVTLVYEDKDDRVSSSFYFTYIDNSLPLGSTFGGDLNQELQSITYRSVSSDVNAETDLLPSMSQEVDSILTTHVKLPFQSREKFTEPHNTLLNPSSILPEAELTTLLDNIYDNSAALSEKFTLLHNSVSKLYVSEETVIHQEILTSNFPNTGILSTASEVLLDDSLFGARAQSELEPSDSVTETVKEEYSRFNDTVLSVELISPTTVRSNETTLSIPNTTLSSLSDGIMEENNTSLVLTTVALARNVTDKNVSMKSTKTSTEYNETVSAITLTENMTTGPTALRTTGKSEIPMKNFTIFHVESIGTTAGRKPSSTTTEMPMKTKASKNITAVPTIAAPTVTTKVYTKPTKYPFKPDNTPTPKKKYTTARTTPKEEENNLTPWRPPVYISVKLRMTISELCSQLHEFSSIIISVLEKKLGEKAHQFAVVVLEELECIPGTNFEKRDAEITVNFFLIDPRGKYDMEVTEKLAELIAESEVDTSGTVFSGKIVAFKVHGVRDKEARVEEKKVPPVDNRKLSGGIIALVAVASMVAIFISIFVVFQLMVCRRRMRMKKMRQVYDGSRPSSCHSIVDSIQLTSVTTFTEQGSKPSFAYYNPALHIGDPSKDFSSNPLDAIGLEEMVEEPDAIEDEFLMLPNVMPKLSEVPVGAEDKNRYANVIPFPSSRVSLLKLEGEEHSEYINANFIRGYLGQPQRYIATQAPLEDTRGDFWRMVWEQQSRVVIMLTNLEEQGLSKCAEYWPNTDGADKVRIYGDYEIILQRREVTENWIQSTMILKHLDRNLCREIQHYWLTCWPDHGTPTDPSVLLRFLLHARPDMEEYRGPTVVHCSPGTGRTGTLLALDICMRSLDDTDTVDVLGTVHMLRQDRAGAVQTQEQYFFIYEAVLQYAVKFCNANRSFKSSMASLELQHR